MMSRLATLSRWQQFGLAALMGSISALAFAPLNLIFAPFIGFPIWLNLMEANQTQSKKRMFALGWWYGVGYFTVGLYWITFALGVDMASFWWIVPFALLGIPSFLGLYVGAISLLLHLTNTHGIGRCFWFAALWTTGEIAWGTGILALPWNPLSSIWSSFDPIFQSLSVLGSYGLTLVTALLVSLPTLLRKDNLHLKQVAVLCISSIFVVATATWGLFRVEMTPVEQGSPSPLIRLVQPSVPQELDWQPGKARQQFIDLVNLSAEFAHEQPDIIVWPESALPLLLGEQESARQVVSQMLKPDGFLIAGTLRRVSGTKEPVRVYNSLMVVDKQGQVAATYDKHHLVPFGEYLPFRNIIPASVSKITGGDLDYSRGPGPDTIDVVGIPAFSPLICFEGIFSSKVVAHDKPRPKWLLNITNDAWYGNSSGPYQHLQLARMRSIEEGLPLIRSANTGISVAFDAFGREIARKPLQEKAVLDVSLPPALQEPTIFAKYGQIIFLVLMITCVGLGILFRRG